MKKTWGVLFLLALVFSCKEDRKELEKVALSDPEPVVIKHYGFDLDEFVVLNDTVRNGDSFGEIMIKNKADYAKVVKVAEEFRDTFDVRKLVAGKPYMILKAKDTTEAAQVFIYQNDLINYTVIDFRDSISAYKSKKRVSYKEREVSGIIESSLSEALDNMGVDYSVTYNLADIYAWTIDFFHLNRGDRFKIIYREKYINDSIYAGSEPIQAAYFEHAGRPIYAFAHKEDSTQNMLDYYDDAAENLRRTFLKAPVQFGRISSRYNLKRRIKYYGYKVRPHKGTDFAAPIGTPILATADGVVTESTRRGGNGKFVKIRHNSTYSTQYLHMKKQNVKVGQTVRQGDVIGWVGMTGNTGGPHVCYRFWKHGSQIDPLREELPKAEPLADSLQPQYFAKINPLKEQLDCIEFKELPVEEILTSTTFDDAI